MDHLLSGDMTSVRTDALSRFAKFLKGARNSPSTEVRVMCGVVAGDVQTTTGSNVRLLQMETCLDPFSATSEAIKKILVSRLPGVPDRDSGGWAT